MKDFLFYPLSALIIGGLIAYALSFAEESAELDLSKGFMLSGEDLQYLQIPERLEFSLITDSQTGTISAALTSNVNKKTAPPSAGISVRLGPEYEKAFEGQTLEMTVRARAGDTSPSPAFQMGYFSIGANSSGWKDYTPSAEYRDYSLRFKKTVAAGERGGDFAGIWPDLDGLGRTLNISAITVKIID
jgi:hypothetical protein